MKYWLGIASKDHVARGVAEGFCQLCHGKKTPLQRMRRGDYILSGVRVPATMPGDHRLRNGCRR